jgi:hypothetical protein
LRCSVNTARESFCGRKKQSQASQGQTAPTPKARDGIKPYAALYDRAGSVARMSCQDLGTLTAFETHNGRSALAAGTSSCPIAAVA